MNRRVAIGVSYAAAIGAAAFGAHAYLVWQEQAGASNLEASARYADASASGNSESSFPTAVSSGSNSVPVAPSSQMENAESADVASADVANDGDVDAVEDNSVQVASIHPPADIGEFVDADAPAFQSAQSEAVSVGEYADPDAMPTEDDFDQKTISVGEFIDAD